MFPLKNFSAGAMACFSLRTDWENTAGPAGRRSQNSPRLVKREPMAIGWAWREIPYPTPLLTSDGCVLTDSVRNLSAASISEAGESKPSVQNVQHRLFFRGDKL